MPDPHDNAKMSGDIHPPDVESGLPLEGESPGAAGLGRTPGERGTIARPGRGIRKSGVLKEGDEQGTTRREAGESQDERG